MFNKPNISNRVVDDLRNSGHTLIYVGHFESQLPESLSHKLILGKGEIKNEKISMKEL